MSTISLLSFLSITSFEDARRHEVHMFLLLAAGILGIVDHLLYQRMTIYEVLGGFLIGAAVLLLGLLTKMQIGTGDGVLLMVTGIFLGFEWNLLLLFLSVMLMGLFSTAGLVTGKLKKTDRIAYFPFVLFAFVLLLALNGGPIHG